MSVRNVDMDAILEGRPRVRGVTIDGDYTRNHDDAFFITSNPDGTTTIEVSVSDAPALVHADSQMDLNAQQLMRDVFYQSRKLASMLPLSLVKEFLSLSAEKIHPAVTFTMTLDRDMAVTDVKVERTAFRNLRRCTISEFDDSLAYGGDKQATEWMDVARRLYTRRQNDMIQAVAYNVPEKLRGQIVVDPMIQKEGKGSAEFLVHEVMALANGAATDYMRKHKLPMAATAYEPHIHERFKVAGAGFETRAKQTDKSVEKKLADLAVTAKVTSPNRSYVDLMNLRTIVAHLEGEAPPHSAQEMKAAAAKDKTLTAHYKAAGEICESAEEMTRALSEMVAGKVEAITRFQMETVGRVQQDVERAYYAMLGQGNEVRGHAPRCDHYDALVRHIGSPRDVQFVVSAATVAGTKMFFTQLQVDSRDLRRTVNVTAAGVSPNHAMDQAAAAALTHLSGKKGPR